MQVAQQTLKVNELSQAQDFSKNQLTLLFGGRDLMKSESFKNFMKEKELGEMVIGCSSCGEISNDGVTDDALVMTGVKFDSPVQMKTAHASISSPEDCHKAGLSVGQALASEDLKFVFLLCNGVGVNGSEVIRGVEEGVGRAIPITGGLAGDNAEFVETFTVLGDEVSSHDAVAVGIYGSDRLKVTHGSDGGWEPFGPPRRVTRAESNILFELDGESALSVYKKYLGDRADELPNSGLLYPFAVVDQGTDSSGLIRTILGIDEEKGSLTLAGDVSQGGTLRLMHSTHGALADGAKSAATQTVGDSVSSAGLGILVSCVGRKIVMGIDVEEELDSVTETLPKGATIAGFYSHGEICPFKGTTLNKLHNQTMTITYLYED